MEKVYIFSFVLVLCWTHIKSQVHSDNICPEASCSSFNCATPSCNCATFKPPDGIAKEWAPQFVLITFNKVVRQEFYEKFNTVFTKNRRNPSGLRITSTLFVADKNGNKNSETTDYCLVQK